MYWDFGDLHSTLGRHWKTRELKLLIIYSVSIRNCACYTPHKISYQLKYGKNHCFFSCKQKQEN